jgi:acetylornithine/N-succinyldiaminopimelate aminotransferase
LQGFNYIEANDISDLRKKVSGKTCAIMLEFIQGEGGVNDLNYEFVEEVSKFCNKNDILLIADEVQTGIGRTGKLMSFQHYNIRPDIVTVAKGLGGGLPIGGIIFSDKTKAALLPGDHGSTFGGNPVVCAGAKYVLDTLDDAFIAEVAKKGEYIKSKLLDISGVLNVSGKGLMIGVSCEGIAGDIVKRGIENGLLLLTAKEKIRMLPPLNISYDEIDKGLEIFGKILKV